jgi:glycosyltransferase involved in cell wall biosynthesis
MKIGMITGNTGKFPSGIGNYLFNLTGQLQENKKNAITIIGYGNTQTFNHFPIKIPYYPKIQYHPILWGRIISLQKKIFSDFDIVHNPAPFPLLTKPGKHYVSTIHDLIPVIFPEWDLLPRVISSRLFYPKLIRDSDRIIADSKNTKKDIVNYYHVDEQKISVVPLGASKEYKQLDYPVVESVKTKYHLNFPFVLFVGTLEPRKNIPTLLKAFSICKKKISGLKLVIVGQKGWKYTEIFSTLADFHLANEVIFLYYIPHEDLPALYNAAELFVYPSFYEGFGLPPLEAMQCGVPVITSNTSSLPEIVGERGNMVNPNDVCGLADMMSLLLSDDNLRKENIRYGLSRAKMFSWEKCAQKTQEVYDEIDEDTN